MKARDILEIVYQALSTFPDDCIDKVNLVRSSRTGELQEVVVTMKAEEGDPDGVKQVWGLDQDSILDPEDMIDPEPKAITIPVMSGGQIRQSFASLGDPTVDESIQNFAKSMCKFFRGEITERQAYNAILRLQESTPMPKVKLRTLQIGDKFQYTSQGITYTKVDNNEIWSKEKGNEPYDHDGTTSFVIPITKEQLPDKS